MLTKFNVNLVKDFVSEDDYKQIDHFIIHSLKLLLEKNGAGAEFTGWLDWPGQIMKSGTLLSEIYACKKRIDEFSPEYIVVIGIGGSYLGTKAVYDALKENFPNISSPQILFAGQHLDSKYHKQLIDFLRNKNFIIVIISKSGTTTEPAIAFRMLRSLLKKQHGEQNNQRIIAITDKEKGALRNLADKDNIQSFIIPDNIGGRYSVFTPVSLVPLALAGFNITELIEGAADAEKFLCKTNTIAENPALKYAALRQIFYQQGKPVELLSTFHPALSTISVWWKQLFGESEGKDQKGIFPASLSYTSDLHSLGQFVQDGLRIFFETFISVEANNEDAEIPLMDNNSDGLEYLSGKKLSYVNKMAETATQLAHIDGGVPVISINIPDISEKSIGELLYFFEFSCAISSYAMGVNPFNQPGVEAYKKNMFALLGKPGFENLQKQLNKRLKGKE